jgi:ABC-2 type transport system permease protein
VTRLIGAEALKLRTVRTFWLLAACTFAAIAAGVTVTAMTSSYTPGTSAARATLALSGLAQTCALLAGVLAFTGEYRHRTMTAVTLITPRRTSVLTAKLFTLAAAGLVFGLITTGVAAAITMPVLAGEHIPSGVSGAQLAGIIAGGGVATALAAAFGVGAGAVIRNQAGAVVAVFALLYVAEPLLGFVPWVGTAIQRYGLAGLVSGITSTSAFPGGARLLGQGPATAVLGGYALLVLFAGAIQLTRRDITA